ncbi:ATP-binding protein [Streptomyces sp. NBC_00536]|uniref:ATP-binding protein n=1 Tax=Streptomyces sp. NBC_00536 TaxID=2975769 RepID=UPI002E823379|nr:ATP-binding protein [Streptomyces sp. NBC_00536]WUC81047.1 ATP-binding protein [Streptomyces sp. NBC_00536]
MVNPKGPLGGPDDGLVVRRWNRDPRCVGRARTELRRALGNWGLAQIEDDALIVVSELLTNASRHARAARGREIETRYVRLTAGVRIEVHDAAPGRPEMLSPDPERDHGRGLFLVDALADRWAAGERCGPGKRVWAELAVPAQGGSHHGG